MNARPWVTAMSAALLVSLCLALPVAQSGSPFYLTVERSFSNTEKPRLRLDYTDPARPILLRVLRPQNVERFLDGQLHISRSYEQPLSELNPGHYVVRGINRAESPLRGLRDMLDPGFRKTLQGTSFNRAIVETTSGELASPPQQVIHNAPAGFSTVREDYLDLQFGGKGTRDLGWWFGDSALREDQYKIRWIELDPLSDGLYLVQAVQGKAEAQCLLQVSSLSVQVKQSSEQLAVRIVTRTQEPVAEAAVSYRDGRGKWIFLDRKTDARGEVVFTSPGGALDGKLLVRAETADGRRAFADTDFLPAVSRDDSVFIVTDRPIFKPGETFSYKGVVRSFDEGELKIPEFRQKDARISLIRADGKATDLASTVPLSGFGSFSGSFDLDEAETPGLYRLVAEIDGKPYGGEFRVRDYVKPTFYLELLERSPTILPGERFTVKFRARRYSGGTPQGTRFEVFLYRKKFEVPQFVAEAGGGLSAGTDYSGEVRSASALADPKRVYSSVEERMAALGNKSADNSWDSAPTIGEGGEVLFEFMVPRLPSQKDEEWIYTLMVRALDPAGTSAVLTENIPVTLSEAHASVRFSRNIAQAGDKDLSLLVHTAYPDGKPAPRGGGVLDVRLEPGPQRAPESVKLSFITDDRGNARVPLPEMSKPGRYSAVAVLDTLEGKPMKRPAGSQPALLIVGGAPGETVVENRELELYTASTLLSPGEKARVFVLLPPNWGQGEKGVLWETFAGRKIYETRSGDFRGRSCLLEVEAKPEYGTGFYHTVTVPSGGGRYREQTLGFRIIPRAKRLDISIRPELEETEPLKPFPVHLEVKDSRGAPSPDTELAVMIVDRAVYAVQPEFRPGIFDFFYPLPRLNLATFYSDELQGYGYADFLKKPNFKLGALKAQSRLPKKALRDTAGWFPHVVTDAGGRATVTVDLPANVTEWRITAMAVDKGGRVGEALGGFRTVSDITQEVIAPQFLRQGETATLQLKTTSRLSDAVSLTSRRTLTGPALLKEGKTRENFTLEKQGERLSPLTVEAAGHEGRAVLNVGIETRVKIHVGGAEDFEIPLKPSAMKQTFSCTQQEDRLVPQWSGLLDSRSGALPPSRAPGSLQESREPGQPGPRAKILDLKIQISSGLLGAALNAAAVLVSYPFGCTEQLVHSTIPNLVLMDLVRKAGIAPPELGSLAPVLARAEKNAALGIKKIIRNQKSDGGFGLWPSDPHSSLPVTLTALYALKFAEELKIEGAQRAFNNGTAWLASSKGKALSGEAALRGYELSRFAETVPYNQPYEDQVAFVERVAGNRDASLQDLVYSLRIFAAFKGRSWNRFNDRFKTTSVERDLVVRLQEALDRFDPDLYLREVRGDSGFLRGMGFEFGVPSVVSAGLGVLDDLKALPEPLESRLKGLLLSQLRNGFWICTFDTAQVIFNSRGVLSREAAAWAREKQEKSRRVAVLRKDGGLLGELSRVPSGFIGTFSAPGTFEDLESLQLAGIEPTESALGSVTVEVPYGSVQPTARGLSVQRTLLRIRGGTTEALDLSRPLRKGELVVSEVKVRRDKQDLKTVPSRFVVVEDGIPSLGRAVDEDAAYLADGGIRPPEESYWANIKETQRHPDKTVRVAQVLPTGELILYQVWQVAFSGRATVPPARAYDMYDESIQGNTEAQSVRAE